MDLNKLCKACGKPTRQDYCNKACQDLAAKWKDRQSYDKK